MDWKIIIIIALAIVIVVENAKKPTGKTADENSTLDIKDAYQPRWLFSYNEKDAYYKLKAITDNLGLHLFAKVRLLDLIEPKKDKKQYQAYFNKVRSKHVDFVVCTSKLVAKIIIELDDNSHNAPSRIERDNFVDEALRNCGYQVIHVRAVTEQDIKPLLETLCKGKEQGD